jgi:hypothetical protein
MRLTQMLVTSTWYWSFGHEKSSLCEKSEVWLWGSAASQYLLYQEKSMSIVAPTAQEMSSDAVKNDMQVKVCRRVGYWNWRFCIVMCGVDLVVSQ